MKKTVVTVKIIIENPKVTDVKLAEEIEYLGSGGKCTELGKALWKLGHFADFQVTKVKTKECCK